jgi:RNA polymerase sigma-70 factor, ECF subfamily
MKPGWRGSAESTAEAERLDGMVLDIISAAQGAYPTVRLPSDVFIAYLGERLPDNVPLPVALRQIHTADLYLACACARGDVHALAAFDDRCLRQLDRVLSRMGIDADVITEVKQEIRNRVLVGDGKRPRIIDFAGRGDLRGWVRVMAVRRALQRQARARREVPMDDEELLQRVVGSNNPALDHAKQLYRREFKQAFEAALQALPARELTLLRQHYVDALTIDELGGLYRVHRTTAARLLVRARLLVLEATRERMMSQLRVQPHELDSIMRMIQSRMDISLPGALRRRRR